MILLPDIGLTRIYRRLRQHTADGGRHSSRLERLRGTDREPDNGRDRTLWTPGSVCPRSKVRPNLAFVDPESPRACRSQGGDRCNEDRPS